MRRPGIGHLLLSGARATDLCPYVVRQAGARWWGSRRGAVAEHGLDNVGASFGQREQGLVMALGVVSLPLLDLGHADAGGAGSRVIAAVLDWNDTRSNTAGVDDHRHSAPPISMSKSAVFPPSDRASTREVMP